ncbi:putative type I polyketide synthase [Apiospora arundinis]
MESHEPYDGPIAIVGMSCKFAGDATSPERLWEVLAEGKSAWSRIPSSRFNLDGVYHASHENVGTINVQGGHFLKEDIALFDAAFFNFSAETSATMDPQIRLLLESVYEALENAGMPLAQVAGSNTSMFAGSFFHDYHDMQMRDPMSLPRFLLTGNSAVMAANRISHFFDLRGPSMTIDTGCSTTLTAVHQACQGLKAGDADMAIVGGSNLIINPDNFVALGSLGFLSPDGKSNGGGEPYLPQGPRSRFFMLSAKDEQACRAMASNLKGYLKSASYKNEDQFLDDLAYTLCQRRTLFPWVSASAADSVSGLITALDNAGSQPRRASGQPPRIGLVFTGQGAQWHAMGRELINAYPTYKASILEADQYLREVGADWSLLEELLRDAATSRVGEVWLSTPLCVAVQVSLVRLLESWGIIPTAVSSHSSGEIAAAYTVGALSYRSAMAVSYCRGDLTSSSTTGKGGMMAVGIGPDAAKALVKQVKSGRANIACINSPSSVTLSGDLTAIEELELMAKEQSLFARRLRVGKAEPQMKPIRYSSPTTGTLMADATELGSPRHWANSLLRPVQFLDAFREMALDADTGAAVDIVIEVGPHAALSGPIGDILTLPEFRNTDIQYLPCLVRNSSSLVTMHALVGQLVGKGVPVKLDAVNFPRGRQNARLLRDLPPYPWTHQVRHWCEPRVNRSRRNNKHLPHDLLGSMVDGTNPNAPIWRHVIRTTELPWVRDHTIQSSIVYPAAGFICMAIEAAYQNSQETDASKIVSGYRLRDIHIHPALIIPEGSDGIELQIALRPTSKKSMSVRGWSEFHISSVGLDNNWTDHCQGLIHAVIQGTSEDQDPVTPPGPALTTPSRTIQPEKIFAGMKSVDICYGPLFQNLVRIEAGGDQSVTTIAIANVASKMPRGYQQKHILHPTTLDSVIFSAYTALPEAGTDFQDSTRIPKAIESMWVSHHIKAEVGSTLQAHTKVKSSNSKGFQSDIYVTEDTVDCGTPKKPVLVVKGLTCQSVGAVSHRQLEQHEKEICATVNWAPDLALMTPNTLKSLLHHSVDQKEAQQLSDRQRACLYFMRAALRCLMPSDVQRLSPRHEQFYNWMQLQCQEGRQADENAEEDQGLIDSVARSGTEGELIGCLGPEVAGILRGEMSPLDLVADTKLMRRYGYGSLKIGSALSQVRELVNLFVHHNPRAKILEIGAGTGGLTRCVLEVIGSRTETGTGPLASEYHFTDTSSEHLDAASKEFTVWDEIMTYQKLDINLDPSKQGFEYGAYDIIISSQALSSTKRLESALAYVRKLLKPGGKLMILEVTKERIETQFISGLVHGHWPGVSDSDCTRPSHNSSATNGSGVNGSVAVEGDNQSSNRILSASQWTGLLQEAGLSGVDLEVRDHESEELNSCSVMLSTTSSSPKSPRIAPVVLVLCNNSLEESWIKALQKSIAEVTGEDVPAVEFLGSVDAKDQICVFLGEMQEPLLPKPSPEIFSAIKSLVLGCKGMLWVTRGGAMECDNPMLALSQGFLRSLRNEYSGKGYVSLDLDPKRPIPSQTDAFIIAQILVASFNEPAAGHDGPRDFDFAERDGVIFTPRLDKDFDRNEFISMDPTRYSLPKVEPMHQPDRPLRLGINTPGLLDTLVFVDNLKLREELGAECIEIEPKTMGLNFRDVMVAMGQLEEKNMGYECAGIITRIGSSAASHGYAVGDRVFCLLDGQWASRVQIHWTTAYPMPADMSFDTAASIPMVFATAYTALYDIARLGKGQSVLIHAAAGGVGQAAIILSQLVGAEVFATAGTKEKRDFIVDKYKLPADHVFSSRDISFATKLMSMKNGVDVVLNCLSGQLLQESFNCLAPYGHFVEIGKFDLEQNSYLEMARFSQVASFSSVDMAALLRDRPAEIHRVLGRIASSLNRKRYMRQMQMGKHIGKIVVSMGSEDSVLVLPLPPSAALRPDSSYLIVGGVRGIGKSIAHWMLARGAKNLILLSRSAKIAGTTDSVVAELEAEHPGARIEVVGCDITDEADLSLALKHCADNLPLIRGVIQGAMVIDDSILEQMTVDQYNAAVSPKVQGTWNLHRHLEMDLDFFIMLSSLAGVIGYASSSNYTAGGTFQDALAKYRVARGLPGVSLDLGVVKSIGLVAAENSIHERMTRHGHLPLDEAQVLAAVESAILDPSPQVMVGFNTGPGPHWDGETGSPLAREARFSALRFRPSSGADESAGSAQKGSDTLAGRLLAAKSSEEADQIITEALMKKIGDIFMIPVEEVIASKSMAAFGVDSLVAVELRNMLALQAGSEVSIFDIMQSSSLMDLARTVASKSSHVTAF